MYKIILKSIKIALVIGVCQAQTKQIKVTQKAKDTRPNIIIIMADDLGYSDLKSYGGEIDTPHIDSIGKRGIKYTQLYNTARCCPTRASMLTGLHPHKAGLGHLVQDRGLPGYRGQITSNTITIAELLKSNGYQTYMTGKWHLSNSWKDDSNKEAWPCSRGFDEFYGFLVGHTSLWNPKYLVKDNDFIPSPKKDYFFTDAMTDASVSYIKKASQKDQPFFMYVAYPNPHYPLHARQKTIAKYNGVYSKGWDKLRAERLKRLKELKLIPETTELSPRDEMVPAWEDEKWPAWQAHRMQVYAAMVDEMDQGIGRILQALKDRNEFDNTLVIFLSDNGASPEGHLFNTIERLNKPWTTKMYPQKLADGRTVNAGDWPDEPLGGPTTYGSYGIKWANLSNTPFRNHKHWNHEGGISTPMLLQWPAAIKGGQINRSLAHVIDFMPTSIELSNSQYPKTFRGHKVHPIEGKSLVPTFTNSLLRDDNDFLCWEHEGHRAVRKGKWKLVLDYPGSWKDVRQQAGKWELYDISQDRSELNDLSSQYPQVVKELATEWDKWAQRNNVIEWHKFDQILMQKPD